MKTKSNKYDKLNYDLSTKKPNFLAPTNIKYFQPFIK